MEFGTVIYINGKEHRCTGFHESFFADSKELPCRPCSQHRIGSNAAFALKQGMAVKTLGNWYSTKPGDPEDFEKRAGAPS